MQLLKVEMEFVTLVLLAVTVSTLVSAIHNKVFQFYSVDLKCVLTYYRPQGKVIFSQASVCPQSASWLLGHR